LKFRVDRVELPPFAFLKTALTMSRREVPFGGLLVEPGSHASIKADSTCLMDNAAPADVDALCALVHKEALSSLSKR
jgi:hypothetical protein